MPPSNIDYTAAELLSIHSVKASDLTIGDSFYKYRSTYKYTLVSIQDSIYSFSLTINILDDLAIKVSKDGSDNSRSLSYPFLTITAAIAFANLMVNSTGVIRINPGIYDESELTVPEGYEIEGVSKNSIIRHTATTSSSLINISSPNSKMSNITLDLITTTADLTLKTVNITANNASLRMENVDILINSTVSGNHYCVYNSGTNTVCDTTYQMRGCNIRLSSEGSGIKRCIYNAAGTFNIFRTICSASRVSTGDDYIGVENDSTSSIYVIGSSVVAYTMDMCSMEGVIKISNTYSKNNCGNVFQCSCGSKNMHFSYTSETAPYWQTSHTGASGSFTDVAYFTYPGSEVYKMTKFEIILGAGASNVLNLRPRLRDYTNGNALITSFQTGIIESASVPVIYSSTTFTNLPSTNNIFLLDIASDTTTGNDVKIQVYGIRIKFD